MKIGLGKLAATTALGALALSVSGCSIGAIIGGMAESYKESSTHAIDALYTGLDGKSFAVVVQTDRLIEASHPGLVAHLTGQITADLAQNTLATHVVPPAELLNYLLQHPEWVAQPTSDLAKTLEVDRLVYIDLYEYTLHEPGNSYLWAGSASGSVSVIEADSPYPDEYAYQASISVQYPDQMGFGPAEMTRQQVSSVLSSRFIDRSSWLFYEHQEPYYPDY